MLSHNEVKKLCLKPNLAEKPIYARVVTYFFSTRIVWALQSLPITPNMVSLASLSSGLLAAYFLFHLTAANFLIAALLIELYYILDCVDGQMARLKKLQNKTGAFVDTAVNYIVMLFLYFSLGCGLFLRTADFRWVLTGFLASISLLWLSMIWHFRASIFVYFLKRAKSFDVTSSDAINRPAKIPAAKKIFSFIQKSLTFPLAMNLLLLCGAISFAYFQTTGEDLTLDLAGLYLSYTAIAAFVSAVLLTWKWAKTLKVDSDYDQLFKERA